MKHDISAYNIVKVELFWERKVSVHDRQKRAGSHGTRAIGSRGLKRQTSQLDGRTTDAELACD